MAQNFSPSGAKVIPQKLKSIFLKGWPSFMTLNSSRSPRTFSEARSMRVVRVENPPVLYESPVTKTVTAANRPSRETRVRLGVPARLKECNVLNSLSKLTAR